jgi:adenine-specific DNA-methyltransferase
VKRIEAKDPESRLAEIAADTLRRLTAMFPEPMTEGPDGVVVNADLLKQLTGDRTVLAKYGLNWHGKHKAYQLAQNPSTGTLRPCPTESVSWGTMQNLMIGGDNLEVLRLLQ